ncbi:MAG: sigma-70 family RNA polymerase sigma factor [Eubacteriales bacterium]|nr:sigma-70 family RNA polymerase sigma factor [Eubacteriales bacterium]
MRKQQKFTEVFLQFRNLVYRYIFERTGNLEDTNEIVQDVFLAFYQNFDHISEEMYKPWLLLTARNQCADHLRKKKVRKETVDSEWIERTEIVSEDNLEMVVERIIREDFTCQILDDLKEKNQTWYEIVEMVNIRGMTTEEAAKHLGMTTQVLTSKLYRARKFIRQKYLKEYREL